MKYGLSLKIRCSMEGSLSAGAAGTSLLLKPPSLFSSFCYISCELKDPMPRAVVLSPVSPSVLSLPQRRMSSHSITYSWAPSKRAEATTGRHTGLKEVDRRWSQTAFTRGRQKDGMQMLTREQSHHDTFVCNVLQISCLSLWAASF